MTTSRLGGERHILHGKSVLLIGGTGSLGQSLLDRILTGHAGTPSKVILFSRDEAKQDRIRQRYRAQASANRSAETRIVTGNLEFCVGDVRDFHAVASVLPRADIIVFAAALKQVPTCEYFPHEAVMTNVHGAENVIRAMRELRLTGKTVLAVSTDKAVNPVNVMGMTKAIQERIFTRASLDLPDSRFLVVRYGNVLATRGSVIPLFNEQIRNGGPVTITHPDMTRFLLSLHDAVDVIFDAIQDARTSETYVPRLRGAQIVDVARALIGNRDIATELTGARPGEKLHEVLISDEESHRTVERGRYFVVAPILPEIRQASLEGPPLDREYSSNADLMDFETVRDMLVRAKLAPAPAGLGELAR